MLGALIGDVMGSVWEGQEPLPIPEAVELWTGLSRFTDDSVLTAAIARWLLTGGTVAEHLHDLGRRHMGRGYGMGFLNWLQSDTPPGPYLSWGNGAAMRVSPVALWARDEAHLMDLARQSAEATHNHPEGIRGAQAAAWAIRFALEHPGQGPALLAAVEAKFGYPLAAFEPDRVRAKGFDLECGPTVTSAIWCAVQGGSFEGTVRQVLGLGGDTDTLSAIAGPIAEGLYGLDEGDLAQLAAYFTASDGVYSVIRALYAHPSVAARLAAWGRRQPEPWPEPPAFQDTSARPDPFLRFKQKLPTFEG
jgi:ADP-ribosylglycohydrolase